MCGAPKEQVVTQKTELDPNLQRLLYGGIFQGPQPAEENVAPSMGGIPATDAGYGASADGGFGGGFGGATGGPSDAAVGNAASGNGGLYAMGGYVTPQQGIASLNQGQMPMQNGSLPNLSDPMTAATLAMAVRQPELQYGAIMSPRGYAMGGYIEGPGTGTSDSVDAVIMQNGQPVQEALLSDGEFVMTERAVRGAGDGDREKGAARMYEMMRQFERGGRV